MTRQDAAASQDLQDIYFENTSFPDEATYNQSLSAKLLMVIGLLIYWVTGHLSLDACWSKAYVKIVSERIMLVTYLIVFDCHQQFFEQRI